MLKQKDMEDAMLSAHTNFMTNLEEKFRYFGTGA